MVSKFKYVPTIEISYPARRYSSAEGIPDKPSTITASWLALLPFKLFASIEPSRSVDCKAVVEQFCNAIEKHHRCPLSGIIAYESSPTPHAHLCMAAPVDLDFDWIRSYLRQQKLASFDVQPFDHHLDGLPYALKTLNSGGEVDYRNLDLYREPKNKRDRKRLARQQKRIAKSKR